MDLNKFRTISNILYNLTSPNPISFDRVYDNLFQAFFLNLTRHVSTDSKYSKLFDTMSKYDFTKINQGKFDQLTYKAQGLNFDQHINAAIQETLQSYVNALKPLLSQDKQAKLALINLG